MSVRLRPKKNDHQKPLSSQQATNRQAKHRKEILGQAKQRGESATQLSLPSAAMGAARLASDLVRRIEHVDARQVVLRRPKARQGTRTGGVKPMHAKKSCS
eukprot:4897419-Pleurochrysis_carterae.AAC.1